MGINDLLQRDHDTILRASGVVVSIVSPDGLSANVNFVGRDISQVIDSDTAITATLRSIDGRISERELQAANYPYIKNGNVDLNGHKIIGVFGKTYEITDTRPDAAFGCINLVLGEVGQRPQQIPQLPNLKFPFMR
jgi:hypothetical protein